MIYLAMYRNSMGEAVDGIDLAQDRDRWRAVANAAMNRRVAQNAGISVIAESY
jgi:hypothetical protein